MNKTKYIGNPMKPLVTVCMTTYNHFLYIEEAIESVLSQGIDNLRIIVADDASIDGTSNICYSLAQKYPDQITLVQHKANVGIQKNLESIYAKIPFETDYLAWFSGDDIMLPGKLKKQIQFLIDHPDYSACFHDTLVREENSKLSYRYNAPITSQKAYEGRIEALLIERGCFISGLSILLNWKKLNHIKHNPNLSIYNDWGYFIEIAMHGKIGYLNEVLGIYRRHQTNITRTHLDENGPVHILDYIKEKYGYHHAINKGLIRHYLAFAFKNLLKGEFSKFAMLYISALRIALKKIKYFQRFLFWHVFLFYQRIGLLFKTGKLLR